MNLRSFALGAALLGSLASTMLAETFKADLTVAADGAGDYKTIQAAIDSIPLDNRQRVVIAVSEGLYQEKVRIDQDCVTLRGAGRGRTKIEYYLPRSEYDRRYDRLGPGVVNLFGEDLVLERLTIENTQPSEEHAFAVYGQPNRLILDDCAVLGNGGDTLSLWNTAHGMYYHRNCRFRGGVDFVCPRGWCFVRDSHFESVSTSAALWHDGHTDLSMKFVLRDCEFDGPTDFWIGRNHYPAQFYLLGCRFSEAMADKALLTVSKPKPGIAPGAYERKFFFNCHRKGGDYAWFANNLSAAPGQPAPESVTPSWTFDGRWDPEATAAPSVRRVCIQGDRVHVYFSERVAGIEQVVIERQDGSIAQYANGEGWRHLVFQGGTPNSRPVRLKAGPGCLYAVTATLAKRRLQERLLPDAEPWKETTILLVGDSTVATYGKDHSYQGWGWALGDLLDSQARVLNHARGGRSSKSFRAEGWWRKALEDKPDYVLIQFGHNDNPGKGAQRETDPGEGGDYRNNLRRYVREARAIGATPILVSPPTRRFFLENGLIDPAEGNVRYAEATLAVAKQENCAVVDLNAKTRRLFNRLGEEHSHWLQPRDDRTHFTKSGAKRIACLLAAGLAQKVASVQQLVIQEELSRH